MNFEKYIEDCKKENVPKVTSFFGLPDPIKLGQALENNGTALILVYRNFGTSGRKSKWRKNRSSHLVQYWRRVFVKIGKVDKNRIKVFYLPVQKLDKQKYNGTRSFVPDVWCPTAGFDKGNIDVSTNPI
jgi:hypothetical protein